MGNRSVFQLYCGIVGILKFFGGIIEEILVGKRDCVFERTSKRGSRTLRSASNRSIWACICDRRSSSGVARTGGLLSACCSGLALWGFSPARRSVLFLEPAERSFSELYLSSRFGSTLTHSSLLNTESLVCSDTCKSGASPRFSCLV